MFVLLIVYRFIKSDIIIRAKYLHVLGDCSFGVYFSHLAIMYVLQYVSYYRIFMFPLNAIVVTAISMCIVNGGKIVLGKNAKWLAFY